MFFTFTEQPGFFQCIKNALKHLKLKILYLKIIFLWLHSKWIGLSGEIPISSVIRACNTKVMGSIPSECMDWLNAVYAPLDKNICQMHTCK